MENLKEYTGEKIKGDQNVFGHHVKDGTEIRIKSIADFEGYKCRIWAPEFHGILLDSAIRDGKKAEILRKNLQYERGALDSVPELKDEGENTYNSYRVMQLAMSCMCSSINSVEAWVNKTIQTEINGLLTFQRLNGDEVEWGANRIEKLRIGEKLFNVVPIIYGIEPIKPHVTARKRFVELISERNSVVHLKNTPKVGDYEVKRANMALKLLRRNPLLIPKNTISILKLIYDKANQELPFWLTENIATLVTAESEVKKY